MGLSFSNWHDPWYLGEAIRAPGFTLDHHQLLAMTLPRGMLLVGGESGPGAADGDRSWPSVARALEVAGLPGALQETCTRGRIQGGQRPDWGCSTTVAAIC
ncbi:MAG: hypothetical protein DWH79_01030 [Planctomycetota bacterium]|nr:MAG: hypothetical protein DWH79_01030 [Planctomycetota bacterium]